jgi:hypothetical protein
MYRWLAARLPKRLRVQPPFAWDNLIPRPEQPSPLSNRLINALFNYFIVADPAVTSHGFDPNKYALAFTDLMYSDNDNRVRYFFIFATQNRLPASEAFVYDMLPVYYRCFNIPLHG